MTGTVDVKAFLERLAVAKNEGRAVIEIDFDRVAHPSCPLPFESLKGVIVYLYMAATVVVMVACRWGLGASWMATLGAVLGASVIYWLFMKRILEGWAKRKIVAQLLASGDAWEKLWRFGGVTLRVDGADAASWVAPKDSWKDAHDRLGS